MPIRPGWGAGVEIRSPCPLVKMPYRSASVARGTPGDTLERQPPPAPPCSRVTETVMQPAELRPSSGPTLAYSRSLPFPCRFHLHRRFHFHRRFPCHAGPAPDHRRKRSSPIQSSRALQDTSPTTHSNQSRATKREWQGKVASQDKQSLPIACRKCVVCECINGKFDTRTATTWEWVSLLRRSRSGNTRLALEELGSAASDSLIG
jgi:hypothetical protein